MSSPRYSESASWEAALEHYQWDRLEEAFSLIDGRGVGETGRLLGHYRLIEAEVITRRKGVIAEVNDWLSIEYVPSDAMGLESDIPSLILAACDDVAERLDWVHSQLTRVAILAEETDADWATYPYGYCANKEPFEKICLPNYLLDDREEFHRAVAHEYAHVITNGLTDGHAPRWLEETISVLAEGQIDAQITLELRTGDSPWLSPNELESVLETRDDEDTQVSRTLRAYQQAGWIGRYLRSVGGNVKLREMLVAHADDNFFANLKLKVLGRDRVDGALRRVYGQGLAQVFDEALTYLVNSD